MHKLIKTDFHLHTCYSDNRDRMTPEEYVAPAKKNGFAAIGFCDHHHNLTQAGWRALRAAADSLTTPELLVSTGYEATFVTGHLCMLNRTEFDGESALLCERQMWRPDNLRIVAHPDNNSCAWRLPLPVGAAGVEVINGGQDLYAYRPSSPCNGLRTYQTYLLLNHPVAAFAQSDCHERMIFGRVWTGMWLPEDTATTWAAIDSAIDERRVFAAMGDITLRVWSDEDTYTVPVLRWETSPGAEITIFCADRPVTYLEPEAAACGYHQPATNGYTWILAKRGLAWAVSSPIRMQPRAADHLEIAAKREDLLANSFVQHQSDRLKRRLEQLIGFETIWTDSLFPVQEYVTWLSALLPDQWPREEFVDGVEELQRRAGLRLQHAATIATAVLDDLTRQRFRDRVGEPDRVHAVVAVPNSGETRGPIQFTVDVPRDWSDVTLVDPAGAEMDFIAQEVDGERDPIHGPRTREQLGEVVTWLRHGEMHEYGLRHVTLTHTDATVEVHFDLYPARLLGEVLQYGQPAAELEQLIADPSVTEFHVHTRMPKRLAILLRIDSLPADGLLTVHVRPGRRSRADMDRRFGVFGNRSLGADLLAEGWVVQVS